MACPATKNGEIDIATLTSVELQSHLEQKFDKNTADYFWVAGLNGENFIQLGRDDLAELIPGAEHFLLRRKILNYIKEINSKSEEVCTQEAVETDVTAPILQLSRAEFRMYSDTELVRADRSGHIQKTVLDQLLKLEQLVVRSVISNMMTACQNLQPPRYPTHMELQEMAINMCRRFPVLKDDEDLNPSKPWMGFLHKMKRRLANKKPVMKPQGPTPKKLKRTPTPEDESSEANTSRSEPVPVIPEETMSDNVTVIHEESLMASHYSLLKKKMDEKQPNTKVIKQLLDLEFEGRKKFVASLPDGKNKVGTILHAYPCFRKPCHTVDEIRRYMSEGATYLEECSSRLGEIWEKLFLWGIRTGDITPSQKGDNEMIILNNVSSMFPVAKKGKGILTILQTDANVECITSRRREPGILATPNSLVVHAENEVFAVLQRNSWTRAILVVMGIHYTFMLPYSYGLETFLSFLQILRKLTPTVDIVHVVRLPSWKHILLYNYKKKQVTFPK